MSQFIVIESTPGYLPEDDDPATFDEYADAVSYLNERAAEYADDPDGNYRVEYGIASADNLAAVIVHDDDKMHDLGRVIQIVRDDEADDQADDDDAETTAEKIVDALGLDEGDLYRRRLGLGADIGAGSAMLAARLLASVASI